MIIDTSGAFELLRQYRVAWLSGRFGAGKTVNSVIMADYLASRYGYRVYANFPLVFADDLPVRYDRRKRVIRAVLIFDEAGLEVFTKLNMLAERMLAYLRKLDVIILLPSFIPPSKRMSFLQYHPVLNFTSAGLPISVYGWRVNLANFRSSGTYIVTWPQQYYRMYDSYVAQDSDMTQAMYQSLLDIITEYAYGGTGKTKEQSVPRDYALASVEDAISALEELLQESIPSDAASGRRRK